MKTNLNIKCNKLIEERDQLTVQIAKMWDIIATENVVRKGCVRNYDMKMTLIHIKHLYDKVINVKLQIQCANMGIKLKDLPENANIINIYKLTAYNNYIVKVDEMMKKHTINPLVKIKKGKRKLAVTEELTYSYLEREKNRYTLLANKIRKEIEDFNNNTEIDNTVPTYLVA